MYIFRLLLLLAASLTWASQGDDADETKAARGIIERIIGSEKAAAFTLEMVNATSSGLDVFELETPAAGKVVVRGSSGVALASGFYYYLRYHCNASVSWGRNKTGIQVSTVRSPLPVLTDKIRIETSSKWRYYLNFCTISYTFAFASLEQWLEEVDWMALHGINLVLAPTGIEHIWAEAYGPNGLGLTEKEITDFFPGAAFLAWNRMANMDGPFGGPLTKAWRDGQAEMSKKLFARMRSLGMKFVQPGFAGMIPCALQRLYPDMNLTHFQWQGFNSSCLVASSDPKFEMLAQQFYKTQRSVFGAGTHFAMDQFNEMMPKFSPGNELRDLAALSQKTYAVLKESNPDAVWVMQAWFLNEIPLCKKVGGSFCNAFWHQGHTGDKYPRAQAYLGGVPKGKLLLLDLQADVYPVYKYTQNFYGQDFIFSIIHNFGQKPGVFGDVATLAKEAILAQTIAPSEFKGTGMMPEGVHNNPIVFELAAEMGWRSPKRPVDLPSWIHQFALSRYGALSSDSSSAWEKLTGPSGPYFISADDGGDSATKEVVNYGCGFQLGRSLTKQAIPIWNATLQAEVSRDLLTAYRTRRSQETLSSGTLRMDLVDNTRQSLDWLLWDACRLFEAAYHRKDAASASRVAGAMYGIATDMDSVLSTDSNFMLGPWIADARAMATSRAEADVLEYNARNQVTLWGPNTGGLEDYARKQWGGLLKSYHLRGRWGIVIEAVLQALREGKSYQAAEAQKTLNEFELAWQKNFTEVFPVEPESDALETIGAVADTYLKYSSVVSDFDIVENMDVDKNNMLLQPAWTKDPAQLLYLCKVEPQCAAVNSNGWFKRASSEKITSQGTTLYLKKSVLNPTTFIV